MDNETPENGTYETHLPDHIELCSPEDLHPRRPPLTLPDLGQGHSRRQ